MRSRSNIVYFCSRVNGIMLVRTAGFNEIVMSVMVRQRVEMDWAATNCDFASLSKPHRFCSAKHPNLLSVYRWRVEGSDISTNNNETAIEDVRTMVIRMTVHKSIR